MIPMVDTTKAHPLVAILVIGQEGDEKTVTVNTHQKCEQLLREGLHALYGKPGPNPDEYDLVFNGTIVEPLSKTIAEAGIADHSSVSILPKTISRGSW
jgi:hypothetical protein